MPNYTYRARDSSGKVVRGVIEADTREELIDRLHKMGYMATDVRETRPGIRIESIFQKILPIGVEDMIMFYVQLSNMINAGIPILESLGAITKETENKKFKEIMESVARSIEAGESFSKALSHHPRVFPKLFLNMVKSGEASGKLDMVLKRYAAYFEHQADLREKIKAALFYPLILLIAGLAVTLFIVTFIIPQFVNVFTKSGMRLPVVTLILFAIGVNIKRFWYVALAFILLLWAAVRYYIDTPSGRLNFDNLKLKLPIMGLLHRKAALSAFSKTLSTLQASGVPILASLDITKEVMGNEVLGRIVGDVRKAVEKGEKISQSLKLSGEFPPNIIQMISVGEETGNLDEMLDKTSDFYDMSLGYTIKKLTTILEPLFLVIMGGLVAFIMSSILLPMFDLVKVIRH